MIFLLVAVFGVLLFHIDARFIEDMNADLERERRLGNVARRVRSIRAPLEANRPVLTLTRGV